MKQDIQTMINLYDLKELKSINRRLKISRCIFCSLIGIFIAGYIVMCCFMEFKLKNIMVPISCAYIFVATVIIMFILIYFISPDKVRKQRLISFDKAYKHKLTAKYISSSELKTLRTDIRGYELKFISDGKTYIFFVEENEINFTFKEELYELELSDNFIVAVKEHLDE